MLKDKPCTKRGILSTITSIFGTLGFVAPSLLEGNKILQELCKENTCPERFKWSIARHTSTIKLNYA